MGVGRSGAAIVAYLRFNVKMVRDLTLPSVENGDGDKR